MDRADNKAMRTSLFVVLLLFIMPFILLKSESSFHYHAAAIGNDQYIRFRHRSCQSGRRWNW